MTAAQGGQDAGGEDDDRETHDEEGQHAAPPLPAVTGVDRSGLRRPGTQDTEPARPHGRDFPAEFR
ncbi:hypothetical protein GCM10010215_06640 [Streptomyces virginiae]|uniref:Uncharacterized protein n=1 Tax=Streptomyces virginiae TaxID=1961 RepID=A0ABQ3NF63_STRVG|nr:hypothetical protein GCM10010215_06640 [Streptomyces virginiae]GHI11367.1 hypothetical protein Scinn_08300 [Streptomyces virginiae]